MLGADRITSSTNRWIKLYKKLHQKSSFRKKEQLFVVEGRKEIHCALEAGYEAEVLLHSSHILPVIPQSIEVETSVLEGLILRESEGVCGIFKRKLHMLPEKLDKSFYLILDGLEKPGNIGALLRTADSVGVDGVIMVDLNCDLYSPTLIRSSLGSLFYSNIYECRFDEFATAADSLNLYTARVDGASSLFEVKFDSPCGIVLGSEANGLERKWHSYRGVKLPMFGKMDSLNVSVSGAVLLYEYRRQHS